MLEDNKAILDAESEDQLTEEEKSFRQEHKIFMNSMFKEQFPDIVEIILIYAQRKNFQHQVQDINNKIIQLVIDIMKDKNDETWN